MAQYCPSRGQYCGHNQAKSGMRLTSFRKDALSFLHPPNNGKNFRPETLARGRLEADYYKCALLEQKSYRQAHRR